MANMTAQEAYKLSVSIPFMNRLSILIDAEAMVVLRELDTVAGHVKRVAFAREVLRSPDSSASVFARELVFDTNLIGAGFSVDGNGNPVDSLATDAAIRSQISTNWNAYSGV